MKQTIVSWTVLLSLCLATVSATFAQTLPSSFNYQGRLTDTAGTPLPNGNYQIIFSLWDAETGGNQLWGSGNKTVALNKGLFATSLGPIPSAALSSANVFLQVQMGTDTPMPRIALGAVPYALKAVELLWPAVATIWSVSPVLTLTNSGAGTAISAVNTGTGSAGYFRIANAANSSSVLIAETNGPGHAVHAFTSGSRSAVYGNTSGGGSGVYGTTSGTGNGVYGTATAGGTAGRFETTGTTNDTTLVVRNQANGSAAFFHSVAGAAGAMGANTSGSGAAGEFTISNYANASPSVWATTNGSGPAIKATPGTGLAGLFQGTLQANTLKLPAGAADGYVLGSDAAGIASWRRDGLTLPYNVTATTADDTFSLKNLGTGKAMWLGIDNSGSTSPTLHITGNQKGPNLLVDGQAQMGGFKMATGASNGYVLTSDATGKGTWKATSNGFADLSATGTISTLNLNVDPNNTNTGTINSGTIRFGTASGEGIFSKRTEGGNQYGLELATNSKPRLSITQSGYVGIGTSAPLGKLHVKGSQTGGYSTPMSYIENTNSTGDSAPALRLSGSGRSVDGVLNISNLGTGKIVSFGSNGGEVANIDVNGNISAKNLPAVVFRCHDDNTHWNAGERKILESATVTAPSDGYYILDATIDYGANSFTDNIAIFYLYLCDVDQEINTILRQSKVSHISPMNLEQQLVISWHEPAFKGQVRTYRLEGEYQQSSSSQFWHTGTTLRVLFVPNRL